jgi:hypothetical protein
MDVVALYKKLRYRSHARYDFPSLVLAVLRFKFLTRGGFAFKTKLEKITPDLQPLLRYLFFLGSQEG